MVFVVAAALAGGAAGAAHYFAAGLTLSHYDARGHLVVARRIFDSLTPGWQQIGAVWLPLPHLLNALPVQIDFFYRTGLSAVALSVMCFAVAAGAIAWIVERLTGSAWAAAAGATVFVLNPNVLYLQATPMTEPLLIALGVLAVALLMAWLDDASPAKAGHDETSRLKPDAVGILFALACLTRYEAWPVTVAALLVATWVLWRRGLPAIDAARQMIPIAIYPAVAIAGFFVFSRIVVGRWFADDFFIPENPARGDLYESLAEIVWGTRMLSGIGVLGVAAVGAAVLMAIAFTRRERAIALLPLVLTGMAAVPFVAFYDGHPYRIRYMVPLIAVEAIAAGVAAGFAPRRPLATGAAMALLAIAGYELRPLSANAPMVTEAQWDLPNRHARQAVSSCLEREYNGGAVMTSMGSLGHYMQDLSRSGFALKDFLHEGNGDIWLAAIVDPLPYAGWMLIEEKAEGGDMLAHIARENPDFLRGFSRVCEGAGVALYRRDTAGSAPPATSARSAVEDRSVTR